MGEEAVVQQRRRRRGVRGGRRPRFPLPAHLFAARGAVGLGVWKVAMVSGRKVKRAT